MRITPIMPITPMASATKRDNQFQDGKFRELLQKSKQSPAKNNSTKSVNAFSDAYSVNK
ncbi:MAG: hypothetical protein E6713_04190 [Sporomusaceae bacterium]|nr:hypothetical protein [Sporomusaceae bacterium]